MKKFPVVISFLICLIISSFAGCWKTSGSQNIRQNPTASGILRADFYDSGFKLADDNYNACFQASNGKVYYILASGSTDIGGQMYELDPAAGKIRHVGDLTEAAGEKGLHAIPQGKGHSIFREFQGNLYFATHVGYYNPPTPDGRELIGTPPPGYKPYPGGHFLSYDLHSGKFDNLARAPAGEGILAFQMDTKRKRLYGLTWPSGLFLRYDIETQKLRNFGPVSEGGEKGIPGSTFRAVCRALVVDPQDGSVYFTTADGNILWYRYDTDSLETVRSCNLRKDVFGIVDPSQPGTMGYSWRQAFWYSPGRVIYAQNGRSGYLFRFDPQKDKVHVLTRLVSDATASSGMFDRYTYGDLGLALGPDSHSIYYLAGAPPKAPVEPFDEDIHLVIYDILSGKCVDYGVLQLQNGLRPFFAQSIAVGRNGMIYTVAKVREGGHVRVDLLSFPNPVR